MKLLGNREPEWGGQRKRHTNMIDKCQKEGGGIGLWATSLLSVFMSCALPLRICLNVSPDTAKFLLFVDHFRSFLGNFLF